MRRREHGFKTEPRNPRCPGISSTSRNRLPGLGPISQQQDKDDLRKNVYALAPKGRALVEDLGGRDEVDRYNCRPSPLWMRLHTA